MAATDIGIPEDIRDIVKGSVTGMQQFVDADVLPMEREMGDILIDERKFFDETGKARPEVMEARKQVRMKSSRAGYYGMFAPESVGGGGLGARHRDRVDRDAREVRRRAASPRVRDAEPRQGRQPGPRRKPAGFHGTAHGG